MLVDCFVAQNRGTVETGAYGAEIWLSPARYIDLQMLLVTCHSHRGEDQSVLLYQKQQTLCKKVDNLPWFWNSLHFIRAITFYFGVADSCILITVITFWCSSAPIVCVSEKLTKCVCDFYVSPDRLQIPFRFEKSSKLLLGKLTCHNNKFAAGSRE